VSKARKTATFFYPDSSMSTDMKIVPGIFDVARDSMSVTISPKQAIRVALGIFGQVIRHPRTFVTFEAWSDR
jgi:hypothetical protein